MAEGKPGPGHNARISEEDRRILYLMHVGKIVTQRASIKEAQEVLKTLKKTAKADGFDMGSEIDFGVKLREAEDDDVIAANLRKTLRAAEYLNLPIGFQPAFNFDAKAPGDGAIEAAFDKGRLDGIMGIGPKAPDGYDGPLATAYMEGWHKGKEEALVVFKRNLEAKNAHVGTPNEILKPDQAKRGPGRPRKDQSAEPPPNTSGSKATPFKKKADAPDPGTGNKAPVEGTKH